MNEYQVQIDQEGVGTSTYGASNSTVSAAAVLSIFKTLSATKKTSSLVKAKSELDWYLDEEPFPHDENEYFDVLGWWKVAGTHFPTLRLIARDILAIPITIVASESAFSPSGRILNEDHSCLTPQMLEALMCSQSWFRHNLKGQDDGKIDTFWSYLEDIEEEMKEEPCISTINSD
nr:zinc finger BED domain-containing protein RICESLEEPER 2-like [Setaria viridis]